MAFSTSSSYQTRIYQAIFGLGMVFFGLYATKSMMFGSRRTGIMLLALVCCAALVFKLDHRYWLLYPFFVFGNFSIRGLPFYGNELGCIFVIAIHFIRTGMHRDHAARFFDPELIFQILMFLWMAVVFCLNPTGLAMFGNSTIGARFYIQVALGIFAMTALSTQRIQEEDAKILFFVILSGLLISLCRGVLFPGVDPDATVFAGATPERSQRYAFTVCGVLFMLLFSRWPLSQILSSPFKFTIAGLLSILVVYSGKRRSFAMLALVPFLRAFLTGRERVMSILLAVFACFLLVFASFGDGVAYRLPRSAKRALAVVIPKYRVSDDDGGMKDIFRKHMRAQAREIIRQNPLVGRKGFAMDLQDTRWMLFGGGRTSLYSGHAYSGNWHSAWYAYAADFGIPCMMLWLFFVVFALRTCWRTGRFADTSTWLGSCAMFFVLRLLTDFVFSYTTGHSATTTLDLMPKFGLLLALSRSLCISHSQGRFS